MKFCNCLSGNSFSDLFADRTDFRHAGGEAFLQLDFNVEDLGFDWLGEFRRAEFVQCYWIVTIDGLPFRVVVAFVEDAP